MGLNPRRLGHPGSLALNQNRYSDRLLAGCAAITGLEGGTADSGNKVTGTITLPVDGSLTGQKYAVYLGTELGSTSSVTKTSGVVSGSTVTFTFSTVPAGTYFVYAVFGHDNAAPTPGDWVAVWGATGMSNVPTAANLKVPSTGTVSADMSAFAYVLTGQDGTGATTVTGTLTLPTDLTGKTFLVVVNDTSTSSSQPIATDVGTVTGTSATYTIHKVPAGTYYIIAIVYNGTPGATGPTTGDYIGFFGGFPPVAEPNVVVPASGTKSGVDISLIAFPTGGSGNTLTLTAPASTTLTGTVTVSGTYSGSAPTSIVVLLGATPFTATFHSGTWTAQVDTTKVVDGSSTLAAVSYNGTTPVDATSPVTVTVANGSSATTGTLTYSVANQSDTSQDAAFPVLLDAYAVGQDGSRTLAKTLKLTGRTDTDSTSLGTGTYVTIEYADRNGNGIIDAGDWIGASGMVDITAGETTPVETYLYPSNISSRTALASTTDLNNLFWSEYDYVGTPPADSTHLTAVITKNPADVTDQTSWLIFPNGGNYTNQRGIVGCPAGTYGLFLFEDANGNGALDQGETYYWPSSTAFPALSADQTAPAGDVAAVLASQTPGPLLTIEYSVADARVYTLSSGNGSIGTVTVN
jgi:uncharacterized protein (DUF2141 family)